MLRWFATQYGVCPTYRQRSGGDIQTKWRGPTARPSGSSSVILLASRCNSTVIETSGSPLSSASHPTGYRRKPALLQNVSSPRRSQSWPNRAMNQGLLELVALPTKHLQSFNVFSPLLGVSLRHPTSHGNCPLRRSGPLSLQACPALDGSSSVSAAHVQCMVRSVWSGATNSACGVPDYAG